MTFSLQVFQDLGTEILQAAFEGYNACVLAYGVVKFQIKLGLPFMVPDLVYKIQMIC
jgi:hypothetical protein